MKFSCDQCSAQYMIADEKVGERGVKVKCKKCQNVIIVRPAAASQPAPQPMGEDKTVLHQPTPGLLESMREGATFGGSDTPNPDSETNPNINMDFGGENVGGSDDEPFGTNASGADTSDEDPFATHAPSQGDEAEKESCV
ncbi:MAG: zinc-ribbon domain-containing protein [Myxococcota bacterium]